jgi:tRNA dimethylallyltransferase
MDSKSCKPRIIVICGATGIGKTAVGIELAEKFGGEIVGADSMQIYRHMNIGTAKPTPAEVARIPHHMIGIVNPDDDYDAVLFSRQARERIADILHRGLIPLVVGGTGLYIKALLHGLFQSKPVNPEIRARLKLDAAEKGSLFLFERLKEADPDTAGRLHPNDTYRIIRALETIESGGESITSLHREHRFGDDPYRPLKIGLQMDRQKLYARIDRRVDLMAEAGLVQEVKKLLNMGYDAGLKSMQSIGYRHVLEFLEEKCSWEECVRTLQRDTRRFAKRQFTWFGADKQVNWFEPDQLDDMAGLIARFLK